MARIGVMVCGHGSRDVNAVAEFQRLVAGLVARLPHYAVESGFLEFARPILARGPRPAARARRRATCSRCRACCSPPATSRTTCPRC